MSREHPELSACKDMLAHLVAFDTVSHRSNLAIIDDLAERLEDVGARVDIYSDETGEKANLFASLGPDGDGGLVLSGHTDVVPTEGQAWTSNPFAVVERDASLYGRGTCDMKGFLAACLVMAPHFAARPLRRPLHFAFTYDEEIGCLGGQALVETLARKGVRPAVAIIGEPTSMRVIDGHKGCHEYSTTFSGLAGHGSDPEAGVNAVSYAAHFVGQLGHLQRQLKKRAPADSPFNPAGSTINVGALQGGIAHNVIPDTARVDWDFRPVQPSDERFVKEELQRFCDTELLPAMRRVHQGGSISTQALGRVDGLMPMQDNEARDLVMALTGANRTDTVAFGTEAGLFQGLGLSAVVCGPGSIDQAHKADEFIALEQLSLCLEMLDKLSAQMAA
ncbi:MAG: acetylornithine deacetylase [Pseudomonadota bacterium]